MASLDALTTPEAIAKFVELYRKCVSPLDLPSDLPTSRISPRSPLISAVRQVRDARHAAAAGARQDEHHRGLTAVCDGACLLGEGW